MVSLIMPAYFATEAHVDMTRDCLESLKYGRPDEVILVNDGSPIPVIPVKSVDVWLNRPNNVGFPQTVNAGLKVAKGDILIIANNDLTFTPGWLEAILAPLEDGYDISSILVSDQGTWVVEDKVTENDKFGSLWAMKRSVYELLGGFDERYGRGYFEDLDYRRQAINAGLKIAKNHAGFVEHVGRATFSVLDPTNQLYRTNRQVFIDKWGFIE